MFNYAIKSTLNIGKEEGCVDPMWRENLSKVVGLLPCDLEKSLVQI